MNVVFLSYAHITNQRDPHEWLRQIVFYTGIAEAMGKITNVESVHCIDYEGILIQNNVRYHFLRLSKYQLYCPFRLHDYVRRLQPKVVIVHGLVFPAQVIQLRFALGGGVKLLVQHHAEKPLRFHRGMLQRLADRFISAYFFSGKELAASWVACGQIANLNKVYEVMEVSSSFTPRNTNDSQRNSRYLWVGRFDENKDPVTLIHAFSDFIKTYCDVSLTVIFRGGDLRKEVMELVEHQQISERVTIMEDVPHNELEKYYNQCGFIISTSHYEGSGTAVCEGMSCGCIPILTDIPSFRMMTEHGSVGFLFKPADRLGLAQLLNKSQTTDAEDLRAKVLKQFSQHLSNDAIAERMLAVINSITR
jgi:glycosyltransferase involved in cell wall biosynthesis